MTIRLTITDRTGRATILSATLNTGPAAADFAGLLPLTLFMEDLFWREKYAGLPRPLAHDDARSFICEPGQIVYWPPGPDLAIFYRRNGEPIPSPGVIVLGRVDGPVSALDVPGALSVVIESAAL
mgnify:CR=1 FL=1